MCSQKGFLDDEKDNWMSDKAHSKCVCAGQSEAARIQREENVFHSIFNASLDISSWPFCSNMRRQTKERSRLLAYFMSQCFFKRSEGLASFR